MRTHREKTSKNNKVLTSLHHHFHCFAGFYSLKRTMITSAASLRILGSEKNSVRNEHRSTSLENIQSKVQCLLCCLDLLGHINILLQL